MMRKRIMRKIPGLCVSLMLACTLAAGSVSAASAETVQTAQRQETEASDSSETVSAHAAEESDHKDPEKPSESSSETNPVENESDFSDTAEKSSGEAEDSPPPEDSKEQDEMKDEKLTEETGSDKTDAAEPTAEDDPENTPYEELLAEDSLIVVTLEQNSSEEVSLEAVENLSENQIEALEEYIEDLGYAVTTEALLSAAADTQVRTVTFNMNGFISMEAEGFGTGYDAMFYLEDGSYQGNSNAYCIDPSRQAPGHNSQGQSISYTTTVHDNRDPLLLKILYYGFGGPEDETGSFASSGPARHILTHLAATRRAAELGIAGAGDYTYQANSTAIRLADALYEHIAQKPDVLGRASILTPVEGQQTILLLAEYKPAEIPSVTELSVSKKVQGTGGNKNTKFHFQLKLSSAGETALPDILHCGLTDGDEPEKTVTVQRKADENKNTAVYSFSLQHGQIITFSELPVGLEYEVTETDGENHGYTVTADNNRGTLDENPAAVSFVNNREMIIPTGAETGFYRSAGLMLLPLLSAAVLILKRRRG